MDAREGRIRRLLKKLVPTLKKNPLAMRSLERMAGSVNKSTERGDIRKPFAEYENFEACMTDQRKEYDEETAEKVCGKLKAKYEKGGLSKRDVSPEFIRKVVVAELLNEGEILKTASGRRIASPFKRVAGKRRVGKAGRVNAGARMKRATQGGLAMKRGTTPHVVLLKIKEAVDRQLVGKREADINLGGIIKQLIIPGSIPKDWEQLTIPDFASVNADAVDFLKRMGYVAGYEDKFSFMGRTSDPGFERGDKITSSFENVHGSRGHAMGGQFTKRRGPSLAQRLIAQKRRLKKEGLLKQEEIPEEEIAAPIEGIPETPDDAILQLTEEVAAQDDAIIQIAEAVDEIATVLEAAETQVAEAAGDAAAIVSEVTGEGEEVFEEEEIVEAPVVEGGNILAARAQKRKTVLSRLKKRRGTRQNLVTVRPGSSQIRKGGSGRAVAWPTIRR